MSGTPERPQGPTVFDMVESALVLILFFYVLYLLQA